MKLPLFRILLLLLGPAVMLRGQEPVRTLVAPTASIAADTVTLQLLTVNPSAETASIASPDRLAARLLADGRIWVVELAAEPTAAPATIAAGGFTSRAYTLVLPAEATGRLIVEAGDSSTATLRAVLDVNRAGVDDAPADRISPLHATPALYEVRRGFLERFGEHDPVYFVYGPDAPGAKFQFSFKYRILGFDTSGDPDQPPSRTLQFGYTQRSLWDVDASSSPFYDTSYMPSVFYESLAPASDDPDGWFTWLGWQAGYQHESNGRDSVDSRSINTLFVRPGVAFGPLDGWHALVSPRVFGYVGGVSDNPLIKDYRGYAEWLISFGKNDGASLSYTGRAGREFNHFTTQLDLTVPLRLQVADFATFLLIQYFNGYGESLLDYNQHSETVRAGISLIR